MKLLRICTVQLPWFTSSDGQALRSKGFASQITGGRASNLPIFQSIRAQRSCSCCNESTGFQLVMELGRMSSPQIGPLSSSRLAALEDDTTQSVSKSNHPGGNDVRLDVSDRPLPDGGEENLKDHLDDGERSRLLVRSVENQNGEGNDARRGSRAEESLAEMEINSLLWMKQPGNEAFKEAYDTWQFKDALFASRVDKKRKQSNSLMNEIYQLIGFYSVFQGVLLTAVAQSNLLMCHNWWTAFFLSLLASLVTVAGVMQKYRSVLALEKTISNEETSRKDCIRRVQSLLQLRENFQLRNVKDITRPVPEQTRLKVSAVLVILVLLLFSALFLASILRILCDSGIEGPAAAPTAL